ncbi:SCO4225 family membrane protein [Streptomyces sp. bgisy022]|uniref:SCO4225 family membrane protein n=1 Tax=Streptomyces sp. bgisy022 TaxID=3413769 RepID=UPI003D756FDE
MAYLVVCVVLVVWAVVASATDDSGESMAGVIPLLATAPASFVVLFLPDHVASAFVACALGAGVNAAIIGWCTRALRRGSAGQQR